MACSLPEHAHQPVNFKFPKRPFGKKNVVYRSFQGNWFQTCNWKWLHYNESNDTAFCHMCMKTRDKRAQLKGHTDDAFVSKIMVLSKIFNVKY